MNETKQNLKNQIKELERLIKETEDLAKNSADKELKELTNQELKSLVEQRKGLEEALNAIDFQEAHSDQGASGEEDPEIKPNEIILEIRAGTGGDEAALFAHDLYRMYIRFAQGKGWKVSQIFLSESTAGGIKTAILSIKGNGVYHLLKEESGVHRVQRVPTTEASGRIHTSTATVAVLPVFKKIQLDIKEEDLEMDFFRSGGAGGQNVNKVSTAVRIKHIPTGMVVECQEERSQLKNRQKAMDMLAAKLYKLMKDQKVKELSEIRSTQVGTAERSEKIRTYNFPQDRITDHRIGENFHNIDAVLGGDLDKIIKKTRDISAKKDTSEN